MNVKLQVDVNINASEDVLKGIETLKRFLPGIQISEVKTQPTVDEKPGELKEEASKPEPEIQISKQEADTQSSKVITMEDVRAKWSILSQRGKQTQVKALIKKYGATKLSDIPAERYQDLLRDAEEI